MTVRTFTLIPRLPHAQPVLLLDFLLCILHLSLGKSNQFVKHLPYRKEADRHAVLGGAPSAQPSALLSNRSCAAGRVGWNYASDCLACATAPSQWDQGAANVCVGIKV